MKSRVYQRVGEVCGEKATANLGEMYIGTIHAYAKRVLEDYFRFGNYNVLDDNQEIAFLLRHGWDMGLYIPGTSTQRVFETFYGPLTWLGMSS